MTYTKENTGALWINKKKEKDTHPDLSGNINIDGVDYWLSGWNKAEDSHPRAPILRITAKRKTDVHKAGMEQANEALNQQQYMPSQAEIDRNNARRTAGEPEQLAPGYDDFRDIPF